MYKRFFLVLFSISMVVADQVEHDYNSAIPTFTKTAHPGRVNLFISSGSATFSNIYDGSESISLDNKFTVRGAMVSASYHGVNGVGISGSHKQERLYYANGADPSRITSTLGFYMVWNEIYPDSSPSMLDGHQFTFPTTRILSGINFMRMKSIDNNYYDALFLTTAFDLIISESLILTNLFKIDIADSDDISWTTLSSKLVYDLDTKISVAPSFVYAQNNSGDYETFVMVDGSYQFRNLNYGYLHIDAKISPYLKFNISGQDVEYSKHEAGINFYFFFN